MKYIIPICLSALALQIFYGCESKRKSNPDIEKLANDSTNSAKAFLSREDSVKATLIQTKPQEPFSIVCYLNDTVFGSGCDGWGYDLLKEGKRFIHQPCIPAIPGQKGFSNEEEAYKTGRFVLDKIERGQMPPSISVDELKSLGIRF